MNDSERFQHLLRQHQILKEHLSWLEQEIDLCRFAQLPSPEPVKLTIEDADPAELGSLVEGLTDETQPLVLSSEVKDVTKGQQGLSSKAIARAEAMIRDYRADEEEKQAKTKRGCILAFVVFMSLCFLLLVLLSRLFY